MLTKQAMVKQDKCKKCDPCLAEKACPPGVLQEEDGLMAVGLGCLGCGSCVKECPHGAVIVI